jgi:hypothetical protein
MFCRDRIRAFLHRACYLIAALNRLKFKTRKGKNNMEYFVEYYPEQSQELTQSEFLGLIREYKERGIDPLIEHDVFTFFNNGHNGERLTIRDEYGIFYG